MIRVLFCIALYIPISSLATTFTVDPSGAFKTIQSVASLVDDGDTVYITAGVYRNQPQVYFTKNDLFISGFNGRPRLEAGAALANKSNGKAIFVISGSNCIVKNIEFANAKVPDDNGAGVRQEGCDLTVTHCSFLGNEMGILGGNYSNCKVTIEHCVFENNGNPKNPGFQHNVYINHIDTLIFQYNYTVNAVAQGHELKSRAQYNLIRYNYIGNLSSNDSRNIDLPNGGTSVLVGNIIEQSEASVNSNLVGYGLEGLSNTGPHNLYAVNNTFVNYKNKGSFIQVKELSDTIFIRNNIFVGKKTGGLFIGSPQVWDSSHNFIDDDIASAGFTNAGSRDYSLTKHSPCINRGTTNLPKGGYTLLPEKIYSDTASYVTRKLFGRIDIGAFEFEGSAALSPPEILNFVVYPNPVTNGVLYTNYTTTFAFEIISMLGKVVWRGLFINGQSYLPEIERGLYVVRVGNSQKVLLVD